uniref:Uncharacterized protein n=1 Tax=Caenorhabditis japonica TaxID=281687 RepID=A0A8R1EJW5_CAEJA
MNIQISNLIYLFVLIGASFANSFREKFLNISTPEDCETSSESREVFGLRYNYYRDATGSVFCFRKRENVSRMSSMSRHFEDPRFMCSNGPMTWYRADGMLTLKIVRVFLVKCLQFHF